MIHFTRLLALSVILFTFLSSVPKNEWTPLLDKNLSAWEMYLSFSHKNNFTGEAPLDEKGQPLMPIGYNKNVKNVFTMIDEQGIHVLKISGEIYGCVFTRKEFENYHLKLKVKFGTKKWPPRLNEPMDSGILYNSQGACGNDYWRSWMLSQEFQIIEKSMGDYWCIGTSQMDIKANKTGETYVYDPRGQKAPFGYGTANGNFCQAGGNYQKGPGQWDLIELISFGDKSLHIVNGNVVMALSGSRYMEGKTSRPLVRGKIQLQSEAAEVYYKEIEIKNIDRIPAQYLSHFK
jgi:hypothetical protein